MYRPALPDDEPALCELAAQCFGQELGTGMTADRGASTAIVGDCLVERPSSFGPWWRWKYASRPEGCHSQVAIDKRSGRIAGHVGGLPFRTWCRGRARVTAQSTDNMLSPELRSGLARVGVFAKLVNSWVDSWFGCERDWVAFGFPSNQNFRIGQRFCKYSLLRPISLLWRPLAARGGSRALGVDVVIAARPPDDVDVLWSATRVDHEFAIERSRAHLAWRYGEHPSVRYAFLEARDASSRRLRGLGVVRTGGLDATTALLVDWIVPLADRVATDALLDALDGWTRAAGLGGLIAWFPEGVAHFELFQELGFRVRYSPLISVGRSWDAKIPTEALRRGFYMTAGDIDFL